MALDDKADLRDQVDLTGAEWIATTDGSEPGVEVAYLATPNGQRVIAMRNGADPTQPVLLFTPSEWDAFVAGTRSGEFDEP